MKKSEEKWNKYVSALREFSEKNGHANVPAAYTAELNGDLLKLGNWVGYIKARGRTGRLSRERMTQLESVNGWHWDTRRPGPSGDPGRDQQIAVARRDGRSLQSIAVEWDLSRQRVHQIVRRLEVKAS